MTDEGCVVYRTKEYRNGEFTRPGMLIYDDTIDIKTKACYYFADGRWQYDRPKLMWCPD